MPKPICVQCSTNDSLLWRNQENGQICNDCYLSNTASKEAEDLEGKDEEDSKNGEGPAARATGKGSRKSARATRSRARAAPPRPAPPPAAPRSATPRAAPPRAAPRGRGRRSLFKRPPLKAPTAHATVITSDHVFYKGIYMQVGDIVSMVDVEGGTYYAQIRGFLTDQYCEKSAVITWLLPTKASPPPEKCFDPATYIIGPEEELPRKLECMEFVLRAPSDYYKASLAPFPPADSQLDNCSGYIWTSLDPKEKT